MFNFSIFKEKNTFLVYLITAVLLLKDCFPNVFPTFIQAIILLGVIWKSNKHTSIKPIIWYGTFLFYCSFELLLNDNFEILITLINTLLYIVAYNFACQRQEDIYHFFKSVAFFGLIVFTFIFFKYYNILGSGRLGDYMEGTTYSNSIQFSYYIIIILCSCISILIFLKKKDIFVYIALITMTIGFVIAAFNGAKKGILTPLFFIIIYIIFRYKRNTIKLFTYIICFFVIVYFFWDTIKDIEILEHYFTERFSGLIAFFSGNNIAVDASTEERASYIPIALNAFLDSPIYGMWGLAHSNIFFKSLIYVNHPHNLYLELLAAGGLILFILYFYFPFMLVFKYGKHLYSSNLHVLLFCFVLTVLFNDINSSSYNIPIQNIIFVIAYKHYFLFQKTTT